MPVDPISMLAPRNRKRIEVATGIAGITLLLSSAELWMHYAYTRPGNPDATIGRLYLLNTHGSIVYLTGHEQLLLNALMIFGGMLFVSAVIIDIAKRPFRSKQ